MAYTQDHLTRLTDAIAQGALSVEYADKKVTYRSLDEMLKIKRDMEFQLGIRKTGVHFTTAEFITGRNNCL